MSKILFLSFLFCLTNPLLAENILILCGSNLLPEQDNSVTKNLRSTIIEAVFSQGFDKGHIVYDADEKGLETLSSDRIINIAKRYKNGKIIVIYFFWEKADAGLNDLEHLTYTLTDSQGNILCQGAISNQENISLAQQLTEELNAFY